MEITMGQAEKGNWAGEIWGGLAAMLVRSLHQSRSV